MVKLANAFRHFKPFKVLVLGDFMLDTYTTGRVKRISPEAPVPVMEVLKQESRPGGAGNVVLNLTTLGASVVAVGRIGNDAEGSELKKCLSCADTSVLLVEPNYKTPVKNRLIADNQQLIRVDFETIQPLCPEVESAIVEKLELLIPQVQIVALSDYGKGFLTHRLIAECLRIAKRANVPTIVDPKGTDFTKYRGATVLKPNLSEAYAAVKMVPPTPLDQVARELLAISKVEILLITRSEAGISVFDAGGTRSDFPVRSKEVLDVTGAGDTVLAMICLGLANGLDIHLATQLANIAAGISIERLGCVQVTLSELACRLLETDSGSKIFDESHTYALHQILKGKRYSLLVLDKGQSMTHALFRTIRQLSGFENQELIIYVRDSKPNDEFIHLLSSLSEVDYIILQTESLKNLCAEIHPHEVYLLEHDQAVRLDQAQEVIDSLIFLSSPS
ncbi:MAG TPA: PfkB family carbohydrate kinase [Chlamydiales bacterium]|nr:PfkB family carbohydrate kinase [Chlamydiales bacterium]